MLNIKHLKTSSYKMLIFSGVLWGFNPLLYKNALLYVSVLGLITMRFLVGAVIIYASNHKKFRKLKSSQKMPVLMFGLFSAIALLWYIYGIEQTTAAHASMISMTFPFMIYMVVSIHLKEKVHKKVIVGSFFASIGLVFILLSSIQSGDKGPSMVGDLMILMSMLFGTLSVVTAKQILKKDRKITPEQMVFMEYTIAGLISLIILAFSSQGLNLAMSLSGISWLVLTVTITGIVPLLMFYRAIRKLPSERIGDTNFISPVVGIIAAAIVLGEAIAPITILGGFIVFLGLYISNNKFKPIHNIHFIVDLEKSFIQRAVEIEKEVVHKVLDLEKKAISMAKSSLR